MPQPIPAPRSSGSTRSTTQPLYWCSYGPENAHPLLVLHGGPGAHHDYLLPQMLRLAERRTLLFYDQRGGGRSRTTDQTPVTWQTLVADLGAVASELNALPLTLLGYSWGGLLAMLYAISAAADPALPAPRRLILIDPAPASRTWRAEFEAEFSRRQQGEEIRRLREELAGSGLRERDPDAYRQRAFELSVAGYFADVSRAAALTPFRVTGRVQQSVWESLGDFDLVPSLSEIRMPALVVHGRHDPIPLDSSEQVARAVGARFLVLEASGHVPYVEQPGALFPVIEQFLDDTDPHVG
jgi:proline iminopeptidase